uniref:Subtilisin NAT n=2 Tax=Talaromyces marneffei PM1 TaxID=1077442 RepID=A0A093UM10_TALMA
MLFRLFIIGSTTDSSIVLSIKQISLIMTNSGTPRFLIPKSPEPEKQTGKGRIIGESLMKPTSPAVLEYPTGKSGNEILSHLINEAMKFLWKPEEDPDRYFDNYKNFLRHRGSIHLHKIVEYCKDEFVRHWASKLPFFLRWVIRINPSLMAATTKLVQHTPLVYAILSENHEIVKVLLEIEDMTSMLQVEPEVKGTCLHVAIEEESPSTSVIAKKLQSFPDVFRRTNNKGETSLHVLVAFLGDEVSPNALEKILTRFQQPNSTEDPPVETTESEEDIFSSPKYRRRVIENILESVPAVISEQVKTGEVKGLTPYQLRVHKLQNSNEVKDFIDASLNDLIIKGDEEAEKLMRYIIVEDPIAKYLRTFCVRTLKDHDEIVKALYEHGKGGHPSISEDFLRELAKHLEFESILSYVALPALEVTPSKRSSLHRRSKGQKHDDKTYSDLRTIFEWLEEHGVKRIVKVTVLDNRDKSHYDSVISKAVAGFQVEHWNWKKIDLSSNHAVMMGWASAQGFNDVSKFSKLERIKLFVKEGYEVPDILKKNIRRFKEQMRFRDPSIDPENPPQEQSNLREAMRLDSGTTNDKSRPRQVQVMEIFDDEEFSYASDFKSSDDFKGEENSWIRSMEHFSNFLQRIKPTNAAPIKIAIIDDGIDATIPDIQRRIAVGKTFSPYPNSTEFMNAYFVPRGLHGTLMARLICKICPKPKLFVARLEERLADDGSSRFTPESAVQAIEWAEACGVDIISMSWTIETRQETGEIKQLKKIINEVGGENGARTGKPPIFLFASASDQGGHIGDASYPGDLRPPCFRIGGSSERGEKLPWVNRDMVDFLLPGQRIPFHDREKDSFTYETGSSLATACAAGLAGLLLYCERVLGESNRIINRGKMEEAFQNLVSPIAPKFPDVSTKLEQGLLEEVKRQTRDKSIQSSSMGLEGLDWDEKQVKDAFAALMNRILPPNQPWARNYST